MCSSVSYIRPFHSFANFLGIVSSDILVVMFSVVDVALYHIFVSLTVLQFSGYCLCLYFSCSVCLLSSPSYLCRVFFLLSY